MKAGFYPRLAIDGIRKNRRLYLPYILTCVGVVLMYYIVSFLQYSETLDGMRGVATLRSFMETGAWVIAIFSAIFLFYTNSFLIRRRKKEFGLYNILGMGKWNIGRILFWESLFVAAVALVVGLALGVALSKLAELILVNTLEGPVGYTFSIPVPALTRSGAVFGAIFLLLFLNTLRQVRTTNPIELLHSENVGEKPPKANWLLGLLGVVMLAVAYYIATTVKDPVTALVLFFLAVVLVILGTYLLFCSGSVLLCRILQKNKRYYYRPNHFVSVSSMAYRMKRNGAGLASICILATMVLVMISSTTSLFVGRESILMKLCPQQIMASIQTLDPAVVRSENMEPVRRELDQLCGQHGVAKPMPVYYTYVYSMGELQGNALETDLDKVKNAYTTITGLTQIYVVPLEDYNRLTHSTKQLEPDEILLHTERVVYTEDTLSLTGGRTFRVREQVESFMENGDTAFLDTVYLYLVVPNLEQALEGLWQTADFSGERTLAVYWSYGVDTQLTEEQQIDLSNSIEARLSQIKEDMGNASMHPSVHCRAERRMDSNSLYGNLFFLGILLSVVFLLAAVLIIYYKQISEGYEDQARFAIMQKVGMTRREIRRSINSQLLTVFFLPLLAAGVHLTFAFPIIRQILLMLGLHDAKLYFLVTAASFLVFALFYVVVYRFTANAYYTIVSDIRGNASD